MEATPNWNSKCDAAISRQFFLLKTADPEYQSYYEHISEDEFWDKYLWDYLGMQFEDLTK